MSLVASYLTGCAQAVTPMPSAVPSAAASTQALPLADGPALMPDRCTECRSVALIESARGTAQDWRALVDRRVNFSAKLSPLKEPVLLLT
jgi:hypothetical protein